MPPRAYFERLFRHARLRCERMVADDENKSARVLAVLHAKDEEIGELKAALNSAAQDAAQAEARLSEREEASALGAVQVEVHAPYPSSGMKATALPPPVVPTKSVSWKRITPSSTMPWFMCHETSNERDASFLTATFCGVLGASDLTDGRGS